MDLTMVERMVDSTVESKEIGKVEHLAYLLVEWKAKQTAVMLVGLLVSKWAASMVVQMEI